MIVGVAMFLYITTVAVYWSIIMSTFCGFVSFVYIYIYIHIDTRNDQLFDIQFDWDIELYHIILFIIVYDHQLIEWD